MLAITSFVFPCVSERILTILNPSRRAGCCFIRGKIILSWSRNINYVYFTWILDFASSSYNPRTSSYFFESISSPSSALRRLLTMAPIALIPYSLILLFLLIQSVIRKPVMKFQWVAARVKLFLTTIISLWIRKSIILCALLREFWLFWLFWAFYFGY